MIKGRALIPSSSVTFRVEYVDAMKNETVLYHSFAHFNANINGEVDLTTDPALSGTYKGVDPMGLFWSLEIIKGQKLPSRIFVRDANTALKMQIQLFRGHVDFDCSILSIQEKVNSSDFITEDTVTRSYLSENVSREEVRVGRLRGTLFVPKIGPPKMPGIIDIFGANGLVEFRAALLASYGYLTYSLPYFAFDDLPKKPEDVELEYFDEAVMYLNQHPLTLTNHLGIIATSRGGDAALITASKHTAIKALVGINCSSYFSHTSWIHKGKPTSFLAPDPTKIITTPKGIITVNTQQMTSREDALIPVENIGAKVLLVCGKDDHCLNAEEMAFKTKKRMQKENKGHQCTIITYPNAGHLIEPPYAPLCDHSYTGGVTRFWGGEKVSHAYAQKDSWKWILNFFSEHLKEEHSLTAKL